MDIPASDCRDRGVRPQFRPASDLFSTGTYGILATNALVEATCTIPTTDACRFFRVFEVN
jgi:hypothetical protein